MAKSFLIFSEMEDVYERNELVLEDFEAEIRRMETSMFEYHEYILEKTEFYATCQSGRR